MKFSESYPIKEKGTNIVVETALDPTTVSIEAQTATVISEGVYFYETKSVIVDGTPTTYYQQYIRGEVVDNAHNLSPGQLVNQQTYVYMCGDNTYGQLGIGDTASRSSPVSVLTSAKLVNVSSDYQDHALALSDNGIIWAWGDNFYGQIGDNTKNGRSSPVSVLGGRQWRTICAANGTSFGVDSNNKLWVWGQSTLGKYGDGQVSAPASSPIQVTKLPQIFSGNIYGRRFK